ncbi:hypothetical protein MVEN_00608900 [Mycena venus]|uniref:DUF6535 domain-containing protein n=1 Tax=Mycena venus TaxID=2733690 RepID=A0A8H6YQP1_9AGAR|nr:hypothetical protein MVEN_00608900 [Mycena venus]
MDDKERDNLEHEAAAAKLWALYVSEAEKYDRGLVESWKSDMEGMLIFAGLFSASLTAFLIESYKTLIPDSGDTGVLLLAQISQQLAAQANGTAFVVTPGPAVPFTPLTSSLVCNVLWFLSLGLSLTCALIATLLEQWARDFLHRADMRSAPVIRARVYSFLYYGLKRFRMHTVVEIIPLLLHASLLFFFAGLVAFLISINIIVTAVVGVMLAVVGGIYAGLTLLPSFHLDCPYRTPLSGPFWQLRCTLSNVMLHRRLVAPSDPPRKSDETIVESMFTQATKYSQERFDRDAKALVWTVKSLSDDAELEPLVEVIPDILWGSDRRRYVYDDHIRRLINDPDVQLLHRIRKFLDGCDSGHLTPEHSRRRQISCYKAQWALASLSNAEASSRPWFPGLLRYPYGPLDPEVISCSLSATALQRSANYHAAQDLLQDTLKYLRMISSAKVAMSHVAGLRRCLTELQVHYDINFDFKFPPMEDSLQWSSESRLSATTDLTQTIEGLPFTAPFAILLAYLDAAQSRSLIPFQFAKTQDLIAPKKMIPLSSASLGRLHSALDRIVDRHMDLFRSEETFQPADEMFCTMLWYWQPEETTAPLPALPWAAIEYLNNRKSPDAVNRAAWSLSGAWKCFAATICHPPSPSVIPTYYPTVRPWRVIMGVSPATSPTDSLAESLTAIWTIFHRNSGSSAMGQMDLLTLEAIIQAVSQSKLPLIGKSVLTLAKTTLLWKLKGSGNVASLSNHSIFPLDPTHVTDQPSGTFENFARRWTEAALQTVTEFIEDCGSIDLPFEAFETLQVFEAGCFAPSTPVRPLYQRRFATAVHKLFHTSVDSPVRDAVVHQVLRSTLLHSYAPNNIPQDSMEESGPWLDDAEASASATLKATFIDYLKKLSPTDKRFELVQELVTQLDALHPENIDESEGVMSSTTDQVSCTFDLDEQHPSLPSP